MIMTMRHSKLQAAATAEVVDHDQDRESARVKIKTLTNRTHPAILANLPLVVEREQVSLPNGNTCFQDDQFSSNANGNYEQLLKDNNISSEPNDHDENPTRFLMELRSENGGSVGKSLRVSSDQKLYRSFLGHSTMTTRDFLCQTESEIDRRKFLDNQLDSIADKYLDYEDKLNLAYYLNEFKCKRCDLSELMSNLVQNTICKLPTPVSKYQLLMLVKELYIINHGDFYKLAKEWNRSVVRHRNNDNQQLNKYQLDLCLYNTMINRYLFLAENSSLLNEDGCFIENHEILSNKLNATSDLLTRQRRRAMELDLQTQQSRLSRIPSSSASSSQSIINNNGAMLALNESILRNLEPQTIDLLTATHLVAPEFEEEKEIDIDNVGEELLTSNLRFCPPVCRGLIDNETGQELRVNEFPGIEVGIRTRLAGGREFSSTSYGSDYSTPNSDSIVSTSLRLINSKQNQSDEEIAVEKLEFRGATDAICRIQAHYDGRHIEREMLRKRDYSNNHDLFSVEQRKQGRQSFKLNSSMKQTRAKESCRTGLDGPISASLSSLNYNPFGSNNINEAAYFTSNENSSVRAANGIISNLHQWSKPGRSMSNRVCSTNGRVNNSNMAFKLKQPIIDHYQRRVDSVASIELSENFLPIVRPRANIPSALTNDNSQYSLPEFTNNNTKYLDRGLYHHHQSARKLYNSSHSPPLDTTCGTHCDRLDQVDDLSGMGKLMTQRRLNNQVNELEPSLEQATTTSDHRMFQDEREGCGNFISLNHSAHDNHGLASAPRERQYSFPDDFVDNFVDDLDGEFLDFKQSGDYNDDDNDINGFISKNQDKRRHKSNPSMSRHHRSPIPCARFSHGIVGDFDDELERFGRNKPMTSQDYEYDYSQNQVFNCDAHYLKSQFQTLDESSMSDEYKNNYPYITEQNGNFYPITTRCNSQFDLNHFEQKHDCWLRENRKMPTNFSYENTSNFVHKSSIPMYQTQQNFHTHCNPYFRFQSNHFPEITAQSNINFVGQQECYQQSASLPSSPLTVPHDKLAQRDWRQTSLLLENQQRLERQNDQQRRRRRHHGSHGSSTEHHRRRHNKNSQQLNHEMGPLSVLASRGAEDQNCCFQLEDCEHSAARSEGGARLESFSQARRCNYQENIREYEGDKNSAIVSLVAEPVGVRLPVSIAEQMKEQANYFVSQENNHRNARVYSTDSERRVQLADGSTNKSSKPNLQVRRTLRVKIKKCRPILGIAIEGGYNVSGQLLPRIVCVHEEGAAYQCGKLKASDLILEVNGVATVNMAHDEIAKLIADAYYKDNHSYIEFLIGESIHA